MDFKNLEEEVYDLLRHDFIADEDDNEYDEDDGRNLCTVPPGVLLEILNTLVVPVVTALISECRLSLEFPRNDYLFQASVFVSVG